MKRKTQSIMPCADMPCADNNGIPMCYICQKYLLSLKDLYHHVTDHTDSQWGDILPRKPKRKKSTVCVPFSLLPTSASVDQSLNVTSINNDEAFRDGEAVDLMKFISPWKVKDIRGRQDLRNTMAGNNGGSKVVLDIDLNQDPMTMMED